VIRRRKDREGLQVQVYAGRDPLTGRKRWVSRQVSGKGRAAMKQARQVEAELLAQIAAGQHRGSKTKTVAELIERWLEWRVSVRPISPTTVAAYRGYIDRSILPSLGRLQVGPPGRGHPGLLLRPPAPPWRQGRPALAASSVRQIHAILSGALTRAVVWGWINHNPARLASPPSREQADTQPPASRTPPACSAPRRPRTPSWGCSYAWQWCWAPAGASCARCAGRRSTWTRARS
jgi:hypothetical protein